MCASPSRSGTAAPTGWVPLSDTLELAAAIPNSTALIDRDGGHFFYSRRLADIVGTLVPPARRGAFETAALARAA